MTIVSSAPFTNLGMTLQSADVDGDGTKDLLVGNPYAKAPLIESGELLVFLSSTTRSNGQIVDADSRVQTTLTGSLRMWLWEISIRRE
jgi:hypothetical protein